MMEKLQIISADGEVRLERELSEATGPLLVIVQGDTLRLENFSKPGDNVLGALVRDGNGWRIVSSNPATRVISGPKSEMDMPLISGVSLSLGGFIFKFDTTTSKSGRVLVWRVGTSPIAVDPVFAGRNVVAQDALIKTIAVNPAMPGDTILEFYPGDDCIEAVSREGERIAIPDGAAFGCGVFRGVVLPADVAPKAVKSRNPFAYASRSLRRRLAMALLIVIGVAAIAAGVNRHAARWEKNAFSTEKHAQRIVINPGQSQADHDEGAYLFSLAFFRDLPLILRPEVSAIATDMIVRSHAFTNLVPVARMEKFLVNVINIQKAVAANRWDVIESQLKLFDRNEFAAYGAESFYDDIAEIVHFVGSAIPKVAFDASRPGGNKMENIAKQIDKMIEDMNDNRFAQLEVTKNLIADIDARMDALEKYVKYRDAFLASVEQDKVTLKTINELTQLYGTIDALLGDGDFAPIVERERGVIRGKLLELGKRDSLLSSLVELAEMVGVDETIVGKWREKAKTIAREIDHHSRRLYTDYRFNAANDPAKAKAILQELISIAPPDSQFGTWAIKEMERITK